MSRAVGVVVTTNAWLTSDPQVRQDENKTSEDDFSILYLVRQYIVDNVVDGLIVNEVP